MKEKKSLLLQTVKQMNIGAIVSGIGFLLYLGTAAMNLEIVKGLVAIVTLECIGIAALIAYWIVQIF